jgi:hypothetical protein
MLRKTVYVGQIVWGQTKTGYYDHYDGPVLRSGEGDCGPARHEALIERPLWDAVQMRLANEDERPCGHSASALCAGGPAPTSATHGTPASPSAASRALP